MRRYERRWIRVKGSSWLTTRIQESSPRKRCNMGATAARRRHCQYSGSATHRIASSAVKHLRWDVLIQPGRLLNQVVDGSRTKSTPPISRGGSSNQQNVPTSAGVEPHRSSEHER